MKISMIKAVMARMYRFVAAIFDGNWDVVSLHCLKKAAAMGDAWSKNNLGVRYLTGKGVPQSFDEAVRLLVSSAQGGLVEAYLNLAWLYYEGKGVEQNYREAADWYAKAVEQGSPIAEYNLGLMYSDGVGVQQNGDLALQLLISAKDKGVFEAESAILKIRSGGCRG